MALEFRYGRDGKLIPKWYGRYEVAGKRFTVDLEVKIAGTPPASMSLRDPGDDKFEVSRGRAKDKLDEAISKARGPEDAARLVERIYEIKTGQALNIVELKDLAAAWGALPRRRERNERYAAQCEVVLNRFVAFVRKEFPKSTDVSMISREIAHAFLNAEAERGVGSKTWNDSLKLLRAAFKHLLPAGAINPFVGTPTKETETVFRKPFSPDELKAILLVAQKDPFIRPIILTGVCTAMRRGDCCLLEWNDVDLEEGFITVKTSKTGVTVDIPIFAMLQAELRQAEAARKGSSFCFPEQAAMYQENPDGITWRVKKVLFEALRKKKVGGLPELSDEETRERGLAYLAGLEDSKKTDHMRSVFALYMDRKATREIIEVAGVTKGSISAYLNAIEAKIGCRVIRGCGTERSLTAFVKTDEKLLANEREDGVRRASIRDFHSFRVTWVTLALTAGMPLELVQRVTGHKTTDIVLKHYFRPGREEFRRTLENAMPQFFMEAVPMKELSARK
jgi:integrase